MAYLSEVRCKRQKIAPHLGKIKLQSGEFSHAQKTDMSTKTRMQQKPMYKLGTSPS